MDTNAYFRHEVKHICSTEVTVLSNSLLWCSFLLITCIHTRDHVNVKNKYEYKLLYVSENTSQQCLQSVSRLQLVVLHSQPLTVALFPLMAKDDWNLLPDNAKVNKSKKKNMTEKWFWPKTCRSFMCPKQFLRSPTCLPGTDAMRCTLQHQTSHSDVTSIIAARYLTLLHATPKLVTSIRSLYAGPHISTSSFKSWSQKFHST